MSFLRRSQARTFGRPLPEPEDPEYLCENDRCVVREEMDVSGPNGRAVLAPGETGTVVEETSSAVVSVVFDNHRFAFQDTLGRLANSVAVLRTKLGRLPPA